MGDTPDLLLHASYAPVSEAEDAGGLGWDWTEWEWHTDLTQFQSHMAQTFGKVAENAVVRGTLLLAAATTVKILT